MYVRRPIKMVLLLPIEEKKKKVYSFPFLFVFIRRRSFLALSFCLTVSQYINLLWMNEYMHNGNVIWNQKHAPPYALRMIHYVPRLVYVYSPRTQRNDRQWNFYLFFRMKWSAKILVLLKFEPTYSNCICQIFYLASNLRFETC